MACVLAVYSFFLVLAVYFFFKKNSSYVTSKMACVLAVHFFFRDRGARSPKLFSKNKAFVLFHHR